MHLTSLTNDVKKQKVKKLFFFYLTVIYSLSSTYPSDEDIALSCRTVSVPAVELTLAAV